LLSLIAFGIGLAMDDPTYAQYGCGLSTRIGWLNFDASPTLRIQRLPLGRLIARHPVFPADALYGDIVKGLPLKAASCVGIYCSHVLEHLALDDFHTAIANTRRYLKPGGIFRFVLPDLEHMARTYIDSHAFMKAAHLGVEKRPRGLSGLLRTWLGNSHHLWMWDYASIAVPLERAGFRDIRRALIGDSADPRFNQIEELSRWENCLGVECRAR
jgi:SAM-dependent methyltransferase